MDVFEKIKLNAFDPRNGGKVMNVLAKKFFSYFFAYAQAIFWGFALLSTIVYPSYVMEVIEDTGPGIFVIFLIFILVPLAFTMLLILGLHRDQQRFIKIHCIYLAVYMIFLASAFVISIYRIFAEEDKFGWWTLLYSSVLIVAHIIIFIIVRSFYLKTYCMPKDSSPGENRPPTNTPAVKTPSGTKALSRTPSSNRVALI